MLMYFILKKIVIDQEQSSYPCGGHSGLMFLHWTMVQEVCVQDLAGHCVAFFGHALYSHSAFLHPGEEELLNCHENLKKCWGKVGNNLLQTGFLCNIPIISKNIGQFLVTFTLLLL